jgi:AcrR family transcriptional regulator
MSSSGGEQITDGLASVTRADAEQSDGPPSRERVAQVQRKRILEATVQLIAERGLRRVTAETVARRAGVSRRTLYDLFGTMEDCAVAALALVRQRATSLVSEAFEREARWTDGVLAGLAALLDFLDREPQLAWVCLVETLAVSRPGLSLRAHELGALTPLLDAGRTHRPLGEHPHALTAEATIASVAGILHMRLVTGKAPPFIDLLGPLASVVLSPYLDEGSLQNALDRAECLARLTIAGRASHAPPPARADVKIPKKLRSLGAHRVRRSLLYIAEHRGASNIEIAQSIGVRHQSQISALLGRLEGDGLLVKHAQGAGRPNAWWLTPHGEAVVCALVDEL